MITDLTKQAIREIMDDDDLTGNLSRMVHELKVVIDEEKASDRSAAIDFAIRCYFGSDQPLRGLLDRLYTRYDEDLLTQDELHQIIDEAQEAPHAQA